MLAAHTHKQRSEKPPSHRSQTNPDATTTSARALHAWYLQERPAAAAGTGTGELLEGRAHGEPQERGEEGPRPLFGPQRQQHLFTGWRATTLACLEQQGQWGGTRRRCHNQMQASWPSPRKGRHLLHLPKALFSKPQRTKWCEGERERRAEENPTQAEPHVSAGNAPRDAKRDAERLGDTLHVLSSGASLEIPAAETEPAQVDGWFPSRDEIQGPENASEGKAPEQSPKESQRGKRQRFSSSLSPPVPSAGPPDDFPLESECKARSQGSHQRRQRLAQHPAEQDKKPWGLGLPRGPSCDDTGTTAPRRWVPTTPWPQGTQVLSWWDAALPFPVGPGLSSSRDFLAESITSLPPTFCRTA